MSKPQYEPPEAKIWAIVPSLRWFSKCDRCGKRRLVSDYFESYNPEENKGWWYECIPCHIDSITSLLMSLLLKVLRETNRGKE